ncbi:hypothetical protein [Mycolicibacterium brumae]|uniref:Uncharacterized protein n=1 Tax=Mycolicibacterium brumae TaxID=85968 RepID=A0A2G5P5Y0_9MYCO|nr:hypothetical protein [Mycolicibacterium brumae]MCV7194028.1 hypothetical protein [Mycolicibacterium brumae]PIB73771.1 hypothetical protein CQY22_015430 [Mycolicibacterium brumae]RWA19941.1 hypothetical protein MBRU_16115 [Mycolicibacterium brumae DSM 44177]UWW09701.1 hypothetical protein L2Z93_002812 [Mycolicibacterium brumae]
MNIGDRISGWVVDSIRVGVKVADAGLEVATVALGAVKQSLGEQGPTTHDAITELLPVRGAIVGANRVAELTESDRALGRMLARGGPADQLTAPGGVVDLLTGLLERASKGGTSSLERILAPGGLADRLLAEEGALERILAEDGIVERLFAEEGVIDKMLAKNGPLDQITEVAEILSRLQPALETLMPTADTLESAVDRLNKAAQSMSGITDRFPRRRATARAKRNAILGPDA